MQGVFYFRERNRKNMSLRPHFLIAVWLMIGSCQEDKKQNGGPIVLGDSSTIVTEIDPNYLSNYVDDIRIATKDTTDQIPDAAENDTARQTVATSETPEPTKQSAAVTPTEKGLSIPFKEVTVFLPDVETRTYRQQDLQRANGATYQWISGKISGNVMKMTGATITKVSQRHITRVNAKTSLGTLTVDGLSHTGNWATLKGTGTSFTILGIDNPEPKQATPAQIRIAVSRAAKNKRMSRQQIQKWEREVRNVRSLEEAPFQTEVGAVMWKIEGKDAQGKPFQKQVRIDIDR